MKLTLITAVFAALMFNPIVAAADIPNHHECVALANAGQTLVEARDSGMSEAETLSIIYSREPSYSRDLFVLLADIAYNRTDLDPEEMFVEVYYMCMSEEA